MTMQTTEARPIWRDSALGARRELALPAGAIDIFERGEGEPVVFVHGLLVNANLWRRVVPRMAHEFHCVTIDLPFGSHRISMPDADLDPPGLARLVIDTIEALGLGPVTLVGNDTGGAICQLVAAARPDLIARLVLTSCDAYENFPPPRFGYLKLVARLPGGVATLGAALRIPAVRRLPLAFGALSKRALAREAIDSYALPAGVARDIRADLRRVLRGLDRRHTIAAAKAFTTFGRPVLLAWSTEDPLFPTRYAHRLAGDFRDARIEWIPGAGTLSPEDQPALVATAIAMFVSRTRTAEDAR
ncbi:alpha/beta fold hydrolase [Nocardia sp. NPDC051570]|uniref:alpha/beta fold hydrolase n=1 Tax=Nocardia sp. NPDC051570 TaxID=3364324 RepID=UPI00379AA097